MKEKTLARLRAAANAARGKSRPVGIPAADFCALVAESGTEDEGLVRAAGKVGTLRRPVYLEPQTLVTLVDSLEPEPPEPLSAEYAPVPFAELPAGHDVTRHAVPLAEPAAEIPDPFTPEIADPGTL